MNLILKLPLGLLLATACSRSPSDTRAPASTVEATSVTAGAAPTAGTVATRGTAPAPPKTGTVMPGGEPCGALGCRRFESAGEALTALLQSAPEIIAFGEAHARKGMDIGVLTATERFEQELLPILAKAGARDLVVELLKPSTGCEKAVAQTRQQQRVVTKEQAPKNQNRFVSLGHTARRLNVVPFLLMPKCEEYEKVANAGPDSVARMLELISSQSERQLRALWSKRQAERRRLVLAYGGAMHNDILHAPAAESDGASERARFSFGASLKQLTKSRYLAVDLIVPEFIADTEVWRALPWFPHFDRAKTSSSATLFQLSEDSFVIIFPHTTTQ